MNVRDQREDRDRRDDEHRDAREAAGDRVARPRVARVLFALLAVAALALGSLGVTCGPGGAPPVTPTCTPSLPDAGTFDNLVSDLAIGTLAGDGTFVPLRDGDIAHLQFGGQGSSMLVVHLWLRGTNITACVAQRTVLEDRDGNVIASEDAGLPTDFMSDTGAWIAGPMYLVYDRASGVPVRLRAEAYGVSVSASVWIDYVPMGDGGLDGP